MKIFDDPTIERFKEQVAKLRRISALLIEAASAIEIVINENEFRGCGCDDFEESHE